MSTRETLPKAVQALHLRIGRVVVDAPAGADRLAITYELQRELRQAIGERLQPSPSEPVVHGSGTLSGRIAEAVASRVRLEAGGR